MLGLEDVENLQPLFEYFESMVQHHSIFLRDLEHRVVVWESRGEETHRIGDVMLKNMVKSNRRFFSSKVSQNCFQIGCSSHL